ncbi:MAG: hypothetical protein ACKVI4_17505, partial [Actinomycetales bacterium]
PPGSPPPPPAPPGSPAHSPYPPGAAPAPPPYEHICLDTCATAGDGQCSDGGLGSLAFGSPAAFRCDYGTDCADCGTRVWPVPPLCENTCVDYAYSYDHDADGVGDGIHCRDSHPGRVARVYETPHDLFAGTGFCGYGTDCALCGRRPVTTVTSASMAGPRVAADAAAYARVHGLSPPPPPTPTEPPVSPPQTSPQTMSPIEARTVTRSLYRKMIT